jgi:hypothetical protein
MSNRGTKLRTVLLVIAYLGAAHFLVGLFFTFRLMFASDAPEGYLWFSLPYVGITAVFVVAIVHGHIYRLRLSGVAVALGLLVSVAACMYDFRNHRYQISGTGHGPTYTIWWWYYEPFWQDYEPGKL